MDDKIINSKISSPDPSELLSFNVNKETWSGLFYKKTKSFFSYYKCNNCKIIYAPEHFTNQELNNLYKKLPANMVQVPSKILEKTQYGYFKVLQKWSSLKGDYLEVGPDIGLFTQYCVLNGKFDFFWLFEPNKLVLPKLNKLLGNRKKKVYPAIEQIEMVDDNKLSTVVIIHVLDHLLDPLKILKKIRKKMKAGAIILIVTHDESSIMRKILGWRWPPFCQQHPQLFNYKTTCSILNRSGFKVLDQRKSKNYFEISFLLKNLLWVFGFKIQKLPRWLNVPVGIKLGNIITIATAA
tara:strand:+ start:1155 stop:2039 length:885 start_codon:yes stop_codon:yes gene_type:complete